MHDCLRSHRMELTPECREEELLLEEVEVGAAGRRCLQLACRVCSSCLAPCERRQGASSLDDDASGRR